MRRPTRRSSARLLALLAAALLSATVIAGCGGDDDGDQDSASQPAPPASDFPAADGRPLEQVLSAASSEGPVVTPAARVLKVGENRFSFGVFSLDREPISSAQVAIYAARGAGLKGEATGPFPARIEDLSTEAAFRAQSTAEDPDSAQVVYVSDVPLPQSGKWTFAALVKEGDSYAASLVPTPSLAGQFDPVAVGEKAPRVSTPTADDVTDLAEIDTREPPSTMHDEDLADVLGRKPVVLLFATPALCQSRICGPVVDIAEQVKRDFGDRVAFIHMEVYEDNELQKGPRPQFEAYRLDSEPWLFVIDREGEVTTAIEGAFSVTELERAVEQVAGA